MRISTEPGDNPRPSPVRTRTWRNTGWFLPVTVSLLPTAIIVILSIIPPPFLNAVNLKVYDFFLLSTRSPASDNAPLIVDIDERSLKQYGQWPWPRFLVAELLEKIQQEKPLAVGLDIMFSEPDRTSPVQVYKNIETYFDIKIPEAQKIPEYLRDNDSLLADILRRGNFVTGFHFSFSDGQLSTHNCTVHPLRIVIHQDTERKTEEQENLGRANAVLCNLPLFDNAVASNGFLDVEPDSDGILRRVPLVMRYQDKIYPHLSLATLIAAIRPETILYKISQYGTSGLVFDNRFIPLDKQGNFAVHFSGSADASLRPFEYISAADLLNGDVAVNKLTEKIVFVGTSAVGLNDFHKMPGEQTVPGVEFHANIVDNILGNTFLRPPQGSAATELSVIMLTGLTGALLFFRFGITGGLLTFLFCGTGLFYGSKSLFSSAGIFLSPLYPTLLLLLNFSLIYPVKLYSAERSTRKKKEEIARMQEAVLEIITALTEARDQETGCHIRRTQGYFRLMAEELRKNKKYRSILTHEEIEVLCKVAPLHDVGKIAVPDSILLKPGRLSDKEFEEIKKHASYGKEIIEAALERVGSNYFLEKALEIVYTHQEKWDGSGYPRGLSGENIPLSGRLMAVADVYDALTSERPYKVPVEHKRAVEIMAADSGTHFDPDLIEVFLNIHERFYAISIQLRKPTATTSEKIH